MKFSNYTYFSIIIILVCISYICYQHIHINDLKSYNGDLTGVISNKDRMIDSLKKKLPQNKPVYSGAVSSKIHGEWQ